MKICLAISTMSSGGAERNTSMLANHFSKNNDVFIKGGSNLVVYDDNFS